MKIGQSVGVDSLFLSHYCGYHRPHDRLTHHSCGFGLQQFPDGSVRVHSFHSRVIPQDFVCQVFGDSVLYIGK